MSFWDKLVYGHQSFKDIKDKTKAEWKRSVCRVLFDARDNNDLRIFDPFLQICCWPDECIERIGKINDMMKGPVQGKATKTRTGMAPSSASSVAETMKNKEVKPGLIFVLI